MPRKARRKSGLPAPLIFQARNFIFGGRVGSKAGASSEKGKGRSMGLSLSWYFRVPVSESNEDLAKTKRSPKCWGMEDGAGYWRVDGLSEVEILRKGMDGEPVVVLISWKRNQEDVSFVEIGIGVVHDYQEVLSGLGEEGSCWCISWVLLVFGKGWPVVSSGWLSGSAGPPGVRKQGMKVYLRGIGEVEVAGHHDHTRERAPSQRELGGRDVLEDEGREERLVGEGLNEVSELITLWDASTARGGFFAGGEHGSSGSNDGGKLMLLGGRFKEGGGGDGAGVGFSA
ncbi:uncharacterized protein G2W53_016442 [Senna tora]|uniref:Uncharacterized protein n=1 Tax=Senna tora TaxID=362788 RepID=A0A834TMY8_9FABA|nr:uncharacterized protein G2W53_016442 [Senna tora]